MDSVFFGNTDPLLLLLMMMMMMMMIPLSLPFRQNLLLRMLAVQMMFMVATVLAVFFGPINNFVLHHGEYARLEDKLVFLSNVVLADAEQSTNAARLRPFLQPCMLFWYAYINSFTAFPPANASGILGLDDAASDLWQHPPPLSRSLKACQSFSFFKTSI
jgi:hypothetical protein